MSRSHLLRKAKAWLVDQCFQRGLDCEGNKELLVARWGSGLWWRWQRTPHASVLLSLPAQAWLLAPEHAAGHGRMQHACRTPWQATARPLVPWQHSQAQQQVSKWIDQAT